MKNKIFCIAFVCAVGLLSKPVYAAEEREKVQAIPIWQEIVFDGHETVMMGYNIDGYTYLRLREYAEKVTDHIAANWQHFDVTYEKEGNCICIERGGHEYEPIGKTDTYMIGTEPKEAIRSDADISVNGAHPPKDVFKGYVIDGYTFYKLRDLHDFTSAGLDIEWHEEERMIEITSPPRTFRGVDENGIACRELK